MKKRHSARALLLTPDFEILLMHVRVHGEAGEVWILPGGGREPGESATQGLEREIYEETGLRDVQPGPHIWTSQSTFMFNGEAVRQTSDYYLCEVEAYDPKPVYLEAGDEREGFIGFRWWTLAELESSTETFGPRNLAQHLRKLQDNGAPREITMLGNWDFISE